ncbi:MAG: NAD-dependent epimerase/dehydratase family protein [Candidatus Pelagibacter sp.]
MNKKIVLTGSSGHLGYNIGKVLINKKYKVLLLLRRHNAYTNELVRAGAKFKIVNFKNIRSIKNALKGYNILINTASNNPYNPEEKILKENTSLTKNIFNSTVATKIKKIIHISSSIIYERKNNNKQIINENSKINYNENEYVKSKLLIEKFIEEFNKKQNIDITKIYPGWIISDQDVYFTTPSKFFYENVYKKKLIFCFNGGISINTVEEISLSIVAAINSKKNSKFILGGQNISYYDLIKNIKLKSKNFFILIKLPKFLLKLISPFLSILSKFSKPFLLLKKQIEYSKKAITSFTYLSSNNAIKKLGYKIKNMDFITSQIVKNCRRHSYKIHGLGKHNFFYDTNLKINKINKNNRILITGVPGNLGNVFIDFIIKYNSLNNNKIYCNLLIQRKFEGLINLPNEFEIYYGSLNDTDVIKKSLKNVKNVFHLASKIYDSSSSSIYRTNYTNSKTFCETLIKNKIKKILYMSTDSVLGYEKDNISFNDNGNYKPFGIYGKSKKDFEDYLILKGKEKKIIYTIIRGFLFFDRNLFKKGGFTELLYSKFQPIIGNGKNFRNVTFKENVVVAFFNILNSNKTNNKIYWIGDRNYKITINQLFKKICNINGINFKPIYLPNFFGFIFKGTFNLLTKLGFNSGGLFTLSKLNLTITSNNDSLSKDTLYKEVINFKKIN